MENQKEEHRSPTPTIDWSWATRSISPDEWQRPAITELHAWNRVKANPALANSVGYFPFPWASLIDALDRGTNDAKRLTELLNRLITAAPAATRRVTVVQHVRLKEHADLLARAGVTDVFWSHATVGMARLPASRAISVHPFPLFPVQVAVSPHAAWTGRDHLFSFVGARTNSWYLSSVRDWIFQHLSDCPLGRVVQRENWHYDNIVYGHQVLKAADDRGPLIDALASQEFVEATANSKFVLCPSGSGPNSIRVWEALAANSIPVILSDSWLPPGDVDLWQRAAVFVPETEREVQRLPERLSLIAANAREVASRLSALSQLKFLYGPQNFIHDITSFALDVQDVAPPPKADGPKVALFGRHANRTPLFPPAYRRHLRSEIRFVEDESDADVIVSGFDNDFISSAEHLSRVRSSNPRQRLVVVSEEPLWDTLWASSPPHSTSGEHGTLDWRCINYFNSDVFDIDILPYDLSRDSERISIYLDRLSANMRMSAEEILGAWAAAELPFVFLAAKHDTDRTELGEAPYSLVAYRNLLAEAFGRPRDGQLGFKTGEKGNHWHLEKLTALSGRVRIMSALENSAHPNYVTEKLFDAFAIGAIPIYAAGQGHWALRFAGGFINVDGLTHVQAEGIIRSFAPDVAFAQKWLEVQANLYDLLASSEAVAKSRRGFCSRLLSAIFRDERRAQMDVAGEPRMTDAERPAETPAEESAPAESATRNRGPRPMSVRTVRLAEDLRLPDYHHLNLEVEQLTGPALTLERGYFRVFKVDGARGLALTTKDLKPVPVEWTGADGQSFDEISLFVPAGGRAHWSVEPSERVQTFLLALASELPSLLARVDAERDWSGWELGVVDFAEHVEQDPVVEEVAEGEVVEVVERDADGTLEGAIGRPAQGSDQLTVAEVVTLDGYEHITLGLTDFESACLSASALFFQLQRMPDCAAITLHRQDIHPDPGDVCWRSLGGEGFANARIFVSRSDGKITWNFDPDSDLVDLMGELLRNLLVSDAYAQDIQSAWRTEASLLATALSQ